MAGPSCAIWSTQRSGSRNSHVDVRKPSKSLHRMLGARGNPSSREFFRDCACAPAPLASQAACDRSGGLTRNRRRTGMTARGAGWAARPWTGSGDVVVEGDAGRFSRDVASIGVVATVILVRLRDEASGSVRRAPGSVRDRRRRAHRDVRAAAAEAGRTVVPGTRLSAGWIAKKAKGCDRFEMRAHAWRLQAVFRATGWVPKH